ncbi:MAG: AbrB/MazE/SpoVT family DNA-binding domain-containing protein [Clostridia bacterium]|nr:AbrB/MazE/SpoVT family DNA-binding domain-containing protein [Clostridia bacterium]
MAGGKHILGRSKGRHIFGTARVGDRGQIVIPKEARSFYQIKTGDTLLILGDDENGMIITKPEVLSRLADTILDQIGKEENHES